MKQNLTFLALFVAVSSLFGQISFVNKNDLLGGKSFHSGVGLAVSDMNGDGRDDIIRLDQGRVLFIQYQGQSGQTFDQKEVGEMAADPVWAMLVGDIDNNGFSDVLAGGRYDGTHCARASADGLSYAITTQDIDQLFTQATNLADINGDGWVDYFACHDDGPSQVWKNDGTGSLVLTTDELMDLAIHPGSTQGDDNNSGNYGSVWTDFDNDGDLDLYIAKCRQGVNSPSDVRRINQLWVNNGSNVYEEKAAEYGLNSGAQSWTADFGDIDNDGDMDCFLTNHDVKSMLLENDGTGHFSDISASSGIETIDGEPIQGVFRDFDNDGFVDILVAGSLEYLFKNNGDKTFSEIVDVFDTNEMESFAVGDLNHDGFQDILGGYAQIYTTPTNIDDVIWMNAGNATSHFLGLNLEGVASNRDAIGSRIELFWPGGRQIRDVRSGESYGIHNSMTAHFGLGTVSTVDSVIIKWPSGHRDTLRSPVADQYLNVTEGGCVTENISISALSPLVFCSGSSAQLEAPAGFAAYEWSNGATSQVATVTSEGSFRVTATRADGCKVVSPFLKTTVDPDQTPVLAAVSDTIFCKGGSATITAPSGYSSYVWSNGATSQAITVSEAGAFFVTAQGLCQPFSSAPMKTTVLDAPLPTVSTAPVAPNMAAVLDATGDEAHWFDAPTGGSELFVGTPFLTAPLAATTDFWVENHEIYGGEAFSTGQADWQGTSNGDPNFNGQIIFDALAPFRLEKVKIRATAVGRRVIELLDENDQVLISKGFQFPNGTSTQTLNLDIPAGKNLKLTTNSDSNMVNLNGVAGPRLRRSDLGVEYPYSIPGVVSINASNVDQDRYYYFFNWQIKTPDRICVSSRVKATAVVDPNVSADYFADAIGLRVFPNPTDDRLLIETDLSENFDGSIEVEDAAGRLVFSKKQAFLSGKQSVSMDLSRFSAGVYFLKIRSEKGLATIRIAKI